MSSVSSLFQLLLILISNNFPQTFLKLPGKIAPDISRVIMPAVYMSQHVRWLHNACSISHHRLCASDVLIRRDHACKSHGNAIIKRQDSYQRDLVYLKTNTSITTINPTLKRIRAPHIHCNLILWFEIFLLQIKKMDSRYHLKCSTNLRLHSLLDYWKPNVAFNWEFKSKKMHPYLTLSGDLWGALCGDFGWIWRRYNGTTLFSHYGLPCCAMI